MSSQPDSATRRRSSSVSSAGPNHYSAVYIPLSGPSKQVSLPIISKHGPSAHTAAIQKLFAKDKTELERGNGHAPRTEAGVASGWKEQGFLRLTVVTDSASNSNGNGEARMGRNTVASKILTGPILAAQHQLLPVHGPAVILAENEDESSESSLEKDFTLEDLKKLLEVYEEASLSGGDVAEPEGGAEETEEPEAAKA